MKFDRAFWHRVADTIAERGHCRNELTDENGAVCLAGAIHCVIHGDPFVHFEHRTEAVAALETVSKRLRLRGDASFAVYWNNEIAKDGQEVIDVLRKIAETAEF